MKNSLLINSINVLMFVFSCCGHLGEIRWKQRQASKVETTNAQPRRQGKPLNLFHIFFFKEYSAIAYDNTITTTKKSLITFCSFKFFSPIYYLHGAGNVCAKL